MNLYNGKIKLGFVNLTSVNYFKRSQKEVKEHAESVKNI